MRIVAFAYACEPDKGSEPGAGWTWVQMLADLGEVWVLTRANNQASIERALRTLQARDRIRFVYVDLPAWMRFWKRGQHGVRVYYVLWQLAALLRARQMHRANPFQLAWHLTMANAWLGSTAPLVGPPFVYGPVGGGIAMPWRLVHALGARGILYELVRAWARFAGRYLNPLARLAWRHARLILVQNPETAAWLPRRHRHKCVVFPNAVVTSRAATPPPLRAGRTALFAGRLVAWKGAALALRAVAGSGKWRLIVCGAGPDERRLRRLALRLGLDGRIDFRGWAPREEVLRTMWEEVDVLLFPSLHDDAPLAVTDALAVGLPVICLDRGGPPVLAQGAALVAALTETPEELRRLLASDLPGFDAVTSRARDLLAETRTRELKALIRELNAGTSSFPTSVEDAA
jgi:glycosyltransferase involved in cell wall biosynthesis